MLWFVDIVDVVLEVFWFGIMEKLGLGFDDLCFCNFNLIYVCLIVYGGNGLYGSWLGIDLVVVVEVGMIIGMFMFEGKL